MSGADSVAARTAHGFGGPPERTATVQRLEHISISFQPQYLPAEGGGATLHTVRGEWQTPLWLGPERRERSGLRALAGHGASVAAAHTSVTCGWL